MLQGIDCTDNTERHNMDILERQAEGREGRQLRIHEGPSAGGSTGGEGENG